MSLFYELFKLLDTPEAKGSRGEKAVQNKLEWINFFGYDGKVLRNLYITNSKGYTTEIDVLYITRKGIFVIESKNYSGYIFGNQNNSKWTTTLYVGKNFFGMKQTEKHHFYNPIWQNKTHVNFLLKYLKKNIPMYSFIVFSDKCEFKALEYNPEETCICHSCHLRYYIKSVWKAQPDYLTDEEINQIYNALLPLTNADNETKVKHVQNIYYKKNNTTICPLCGGRLVLRTAKNGKYAGNQFYGCSNFPNCRYTKNLNI